MYWLKCWSVFQSLLQIKIMKIVKVSNVDF